MRKEKYSTIIPDFGQLLYGLRHPIILIIFQTETPASYNLRGIVVLQT